MIWGGRLKRHEKSTRDYWGGGEKSELMLIEGGEKLKTTR